WALAANRPQDVVGGYKWELYDLSKDWTQDNDLARTNPEKLRQMQELFLVEAAKYQVFPLDNSLSTRLLAPRPSLTAGRTAFPYSPPVAALPPPAPPRVLDRNHTTTTAATV